MADRLIGMRVLSECEPADAVGGPEVNCRRDWRRPEVKSVSVAIWMEQNPLQELCDNAVLGAERKELGCQAEVSGRMDSE